MSDETNQRKLDHIRVATDEASVDREKNYFDDIALIHRALPELNRDDVDPSIEFLGKKLSFPLLISSMTGGDHEQARRINRNLAIAAEETGIAMGVGSQRVMFTHPEAANSFALRPLAPSALLMSNIGAVQFNCGFGIEQCLKAVDILEADALFLHLNPLQEAVQTEGDTNFKGLTEKIRQLTEELPCPVIIKEVGAGISVQDAKLLKTCGIQYIDIAGSGGTSWSRIEHHRRTDQCSLGLTFQDWGIPSSEVLRSLNDIDGITLIASGGIRTGIDMVKAMILGASLCGIARPLLQPAMESSDAVVQHIKRLRKEFVTTMFLLGIERADDVIKNTALLR